MQVGESEVVCVVDDDGVGIRDVDAVLHDGGGEQNVVVVVHEAHDDALHLLGLHLSVADGDACVGHILLNVQGNLRQVRYAVVDEENLSVTAHFEVDSLGYLRPCVVLDNLRLDGIAVGGWSLNDAHVAGPHQRELEGARNGRGTHGERVDIDFHFAQFLLHGHAELLLLVHDEQSQVAELHGLADEFVCADDDVYLAGFEVGENLFRLLGTSSPREIVHADGHALQSGGERLVVLVGQYGGGHHDGHLLGVACCLESGADGHFGLAESHIAAHQPVHGAGLLHVGLHVVSGLQLVGRILVEETGLQFVLQVRIGTEGESFLPPSGGIKADEVAGDVLDTAFRTFLHAVPCPSSKRGEARLVFSILALVLTYFI